MSPRYTGWLGPSGELYNSFKADSGRGAIASFLIFSSGQSRKSDGPACIGYEEEQQWDEASANFNGSLPGLDSGATQNVSRTLVLTSKKYGITLASLVATGSPRLWLWGTDSATARGAEIQALGGRFDSLPPWPGQAAERLLIVQTVRKTAPANPNTGAGTWQPIALIKEARFSRNYGLIYLNYWYYDRQGHLREQKMLRY